MAAMELENLRSVGILGQGGSGKTSLAEAMLFAAGATQRLGRVQDGTSIFDYEPEEIKHQVSISSAFHSLSWKKHSLTVADTPGYAAFLADSINCTRAFGAAVFFSFLTAVSALATGTTSYSLDFLLRNRAL